MARSLNKEPSNALESSRAINDNDVWQAALYLEYKREGVGAGMSEKEAEQYAESMME